MITNYLDVNKIVEFRNKSYRFRLNPVGYKLLIQQYNGTSWTKVGEWKRNPLGETNSFRFVIVSGELCLRQLRTYGSWSGVEGASFDTIEYFNA